jgi:hypothetical protein
VIEVGERRAGRIVTTVEHRVFCAVRLCGDNKILVAPTDLLRENEACRAGWVLRRRGWMCPACAKTEEKRR